MPEKKKKRKKLFTGTAKEQLESLTTWAKTESFLAGGPEMVKQATKAISADAKVRKPFSTMPGGKI